MERNKGCVRRKPAQERYRYHGVSDLPFFRELRFVLHDLGVFHGKFGCLVNRNTRFFCVENDCGCQNCRHGFVRLRRVHQRRCVWAASDIREAMGRPTSICPRQPIHFLASRARLRVPMLPPSRCRTPAPRKKRRFRLAEVGRPSPSPPRRLSPSRASHCSSSVARRKRSETPHTNRTAAGTPRRPFVYSDGINNCRRESNTVSNAMSLA